ncbi:MAG: hypothetical protein JSU94_05695 [Phycisphaerales bacterium]|nr:MAG: hypothetical protein JSU94_05695 [Phycisphaerales bacterium]
MCSLNVSERKVYIDRFTQVLAVVTLILAIVIGGCSSDEGTGEKQSSGRSARNRGEHDRNGSEHDGEGGEHGTEGEESGTQLGLNDIYDKIRNGVRLTIAYDAQSNSFNGTVQNTTNKTLQRVRVEVHLSNGKELGPTTPADLAPGERADVKLTATSKNFNGWTAHPEVGTGEHDIGERRGQHDREGRVEHE